MAEQVQEAWMEERLTDILLIDVKRTLYHVSRNKIMRKMNVLGADEDLVRWMRSFMSERRVSLVVDSHQCEGWKKSWKGACLPDSQITVDGC